MRGAVLAGLLSVLAGCGSGPAPATPPGPAAPEAAPVGPSWSAWSEPKEGLSCRALLPARVRRGDPVPVEVEFRVDPALVTPGKKYISLRADRAHLLLRNLAVEGAEPVRVDFGCEKILETPVLEEEGVESPPQTERERHPDWTPIEDAVGTALEYRFPLARCWDAVAPGEWEARVEVDAWSTVEAASLWSGSLATLPLHLAVEEPPLRRIHALVPSMLRVRTGRVRGTVEIGFAEGDGDFADLEPRNGFTLGVSSGTEGGAGWESIGPSWEGFEFGESFDTMGPGEKGPLDRTYTIEVWEAATGSEGSLADLMLADTGRRSLWKRSFRVTATAAEIEALRR